VFTTDAAVIAHGSNYLTAAAFTLAAYPILFVTVFMMQGLKRPGYGLWMGIYRQVLAPVFVFQTLVFTLGWGLWGVWWGFCFVTWSAALFALWWGWRTVNLQRAQ
jgi:MATE family, multidrug efflux pump